MRWLKSRDKRDKMIMDGSRGIYTTMDLGLHSKMHHPLFFLIKLLLLKTIRWTSNNNNNNVSA